MATVVDLTKQREAGYSGSKKWQVAYTLENGVRKRAQFRKRRDALALQKIVELRGIHDEFKEILSDLIARGQKAYGVDALPFYAIPNSNLPVELMDACLRIGMKSPRFYAYHEHPPAIYFLFCYGKLRYVGETEMVGRRMYDHYNSKDLYFDEIVFLPAPKNKKKRKQLEQAFIKYLSPPDNKVRKEKCDENTISLPTDGRLAVKKNLRYVQLRERLKSR